MKIVQINSVCGSGSTGKICVAVSQFLNDKNVENYIMYSSGNNSYQQGIKYMSSLEIKIQALKSRIFGNYGFNSKSATKRLVNELDKIAPDIVHLHNLHGHNVHLGLLFSYLKKKNIKIFWTFHDCWAFTGYCPNYDMIGCEQWKKGGCKKCPQKKHYSWIFDRSEYLYQKKKKLFSELNLIIITPSKWLKSQVEQSFLKDYEIKVINNGIDLSVFKPTESNFRQKYNIEDKFVVLGVAFDWGVRKGLDVFIELSKHLDDSFRIVLVGTDDRVDKLLPDNMILIHRTQNQKELAEIYTAANVFVNPTREENYPTTHMESVACGTPVVAFDIGGCKEMLNEHCGIVVEKNNIDSLAQQIKRVCENGCFSQERCVGQSMNFCEHDRYMEYFDLYR